LSANNPQSILPAALHSAAAEPRVVKNLSSLTTFSQHSNKALPYAGIDYVTYMHLCVLIE